VRPVPRRQVRDWKVGVHGSGPGCGTGRSSTSSASIATTRTIRVQPLAPMLRRPPRSGQEVIPREEPPSAAETGICRARNPRRHVHRMSRRKMMKGVAAVLGAMRSRRRTPRLRLGVVLPEELPELSRRNSTVCSPGSRRSTARSTRRGHGPRHPPVEGSSTGTASTCPLHRLRRCVYACVEENNQSATADPLDPGAAAQQGARRRPRGGGALLQPREGPEKGHFYMPVQCQQCEHPRA